MRNGQGTAQPRRLFTLVLSLVVSIATFALTTGLGTASGQPGQPPGPPDRGGVVTSTVEGMVDGAPIQNGKFTPSRFEVQDGQLMAIGDITGATDAIPDLNLQDLALPVNTAATQASCDVLNLVLGPLNLNVLGLVVDLSKVTLDITAEPGPGNLLGNLLCSVAGLLDGPVNGLAGLLNNLLRALGLG